MIILPWSIPGLWLLPSPIVLFLYFSIYSHILYWFFLTFSLFFVLVFWSPSSVTSYMLFTPQFSPGVCWLSTWYFYHGVELLCDFPPSVVFWIIYLLIKYCTFLPLPFPSSDFAHLNVLLCITITPIRISFIMEHLYPKLQWLPHSPPSQPLGSTLLAGTTLLRNFHCPHFTLYKLLIGTAGFLYIMQR
jgi:hypothetical protein